MNDIAQTLEKTVRDELQSRSANDRDRLLRLKSRFLDLVNRGLVKRQEYELPGLDETERHFFQLHRQRERT